MIYFQLIYEFFKIGLFSFGGGYATMPFLLEISENYGWYTPKELSHMTAVASITPGPVGINAATYAGMKTAGIFGAVFATISEILPSLILVIFVSKILAKYRENFYVKAVIETLKPVSCALLISVALGLLQLELHNIKGLLLLAFLLLLSWKSKKDPIFYILLSAIIGVLFNYIFD